MARQAPATLVACLLCLLLSACLGQQENPVCTCVDPGVEPGPDELVCVDGVQFKSKNLACCAGALTPTAQVIGGDCNILQSGLPVAVPIVTGAGDVDNTAMPGVIQPVVTSVEPVPVALPTVAPLPTVTPVAVEPNVTMINTKAVGLKCPKGDTGVQCFVNPCQYSTSPCNGKAGYTCYSNYCNEPPTLCGVPINATSCTAVYVKNGQKKVAKECYPQELPPLTCAKGDSSVPCLVAPCQVSNSPCKDKAGFQCVDKYCANATTYLGTKLPGGVCTAIYVNTLERKVATECTPDLFPCPCPKILSPVCGQDGTTYQNRCLAKCANVPVKYSGACQTILCKCADIGPQVCGKNGKTYPNACAAGCDGTTVVSEGPCKPAPTCLPAGSPCTTTANKCCSNLTCSTGPVERVGVTAGTCVLYPPRG